MPSSTAVACEAAQDVGPLQAGLLKLRERQKAGNAQYFSHSSAGAAEGYSSATSWQRTRRSEPAHCGLQPRPAISRWNQQCSTNRSLPGDSSVLSWHAICLEARAEADRKRGFNPTLNDAPELKQWLISDVMGQLFSAPTSGRQPPSRSSALAPMRREASGTANWPGAGVYGNSVAAAAETRMGMKPPGAQDGRR